MSRTLAVICLVLAMASISFADVLITSWEDPTNAEMSGWGASFAPGQTTGVTDGTYSLGIVSGVGWGFIGQVAALSGEPTGPSFDAATKLEMDVTVVGTDWSGDNGFQWGVVVNSGTTGWSQHDIGAWYWGGGVGGTGADFTEHIVLDLTTLKAPVAAGWAQVILYQNSYSNDSSMSVRFITLTT